MENPQPSMGATDGAPRWRLFLRALADEIEAVAGPAERDRMLRGAGVRMAKLMPLPEVRSLEALEMEMNEALAAIGWGHVRLSLNEAERNLSISHAGLPHIGSLGTPPGTWLAPMLEGLYETWMAQQPGSDPALRARLAGPATSERVTLRFGRP
jgi:Cellulose synthase subunit D